MSISQTKYINIVSSVGGTPRVDQRDLMGRVFTSNTLVPAGQVVEFSGGSIAALQSVGQYFGLQSQEYAFATKYFQVTKTATTPQKISFARVNGNASPATLIGAVNASPLSSIQALANGTITLTVNGTETTADSINFSTATSFANVATILQTALESANVTVEYNAGLGRFIVSTVEAGAGQTISFATGTAAVALGLTATSGIVSVGADSGTPLEAVTESVNVSNNFFGFVFLDDLSISDITAIAGWVSAQNVRYMFSVSVNAANAADVQAAVNGMDGVALTLDINDEMAAFMPVSRIAAVDYSQPNAAISMDYQQFTGVTPSVVSDTEASTYDAIKVNYYGTTQQAGQQVAWYQPGVLQGTISDMGVFANEAWLKDSFTSSLLNLRLGLNTLPASQTGIALVLGTLMETVNLALYNGVILPGKTLDNVQKAFISQVSGDVDAWQSVQGSGYYLTADLQKYTENSVEKYKASFLLIYSKGDSINYIDGRDILI